MNLSEQNCMQKEVQTAINEAGIDITFNISSENALGRDTTDNRITKGEQKVVTMKCHPFIIQPNVWQLEKFGLKDEVDATATTSVLDWKESNVLYNDIDVIRIKAFVYDESYMVETKRPYKKAGNDFLYIVLGLKRA